MLLALSLWKHTVSFQAHWLLTKLETPPQILRYTITMVCGMFIE